MRFYQVKGVESCALPMTRSMMNKAREKGVAADAVLPDRKSVVLGKCVLGCVAVVGGGGLVLGGGGG
ncbi:hypothetical protein MMB01_24135, partial [Salmonella enterica]|nr:hypothetical protein [Salmonella enterica]